ncbi:MAG: arylesterase [Rhizobiales bacterium]|nr:arylesterase [Hyphomicrobiales bacterium]NRB14600.1 arylesterase [Hyphomicrobiales bacterium]
MVKYIVNFKRLIAATGFLFAASFATQSLAIETQAKLFILGDSLTAGYGLDDLADSFPNKLANELTKMGKNVVVIGSGVSGDTSTSANERLLWALGDVKAENIKYAIIELGANDAFRGVSPAETKLALQAIIDKLAAQNIKTMLAGMLAPPNMGDEYEAEFSQIFIDLARENELLFYPFFLKGVAGQLNLNQKDGIHPTPEGVDMIIVNIMPSILELIE